MSDFRVESVSDSSPDQNIQPSSHCKIRVLGIGGGGGNALQHMINESISGVEFIAINTDSQALQKTNAQCKVQIGVKLTGGLGAGCDPNKGRKAAEESRDDVKKLLQGSDMVFITAGMGGGTGTGAAPIIAEIARETGALTVAVVTKPFRFEGKRHMVNAESGITELSKHVDSLIVIDNDKLLKNLGANISIISAFNEANDVLLNAVKGITDSITHVGYINLDFADVQTVMRGRGHAMIGNGTGKGANFVEDAVERAIHSPLIEPVDISSAAGLLVNVRTNPNFPISKWTDVMSAVQAYADEEADCKFGLIFDDGLAEDEISITILITGISASDSNPQENAARTGRSNELNRADIEKINNIGFFNTMTSRNGGQLQSSQGMVQQQGAKSPFTVGVQKSRIENVNLGNTSIPPAMNFTSQPEREQPTELPIGGAKSDDDSGLWDLPPIIRNKSE
ncbi:MAG: cell division protein FtsZ [Succinivibrio sp.]